MTGIKVDVLQMKFGLLKLDTSELHSTFTYNVVVEMCKIPKVKDIATFHTAVQINVSCFLNQRTTDIAIHDTMFMIH